MTTLRVASLFSGIGLLDHGLSLAGMPTGLLCEADKHCRSVLARHYPDIPIHDDVRTLTGHDLRTAGLDPDRTVLAAGFPCQDISVAGRRKGMGRGTRSGLYWQIVRLLAEFPARWLCLENVPGLLSSHGGRDMGAVVGSLGELGYGLAWRVLDAQYTGVPQRRRRVVIVGHLGTPWGAPAEVLFEPEGVPGDSAAVGEAGSGTAAGPAGSPRSRRVAGTLQAHHGRNDADTSANLVTYQRVVRSGARGPDGELPPDVWAQRNVVATLSPFDLGSDSRAVELVVTHALTANGHDASEDGTGRGTPLVVGTLRAQWGHGDKGEHLTAFHLTQDPVSGAVAPTLGKGTGGQGVADGMHVRRLTPLECERLQGAPDGWTAGQSDSRRYTQIGNAVAVPVFRLVGERIVKVDNAMRAEGAA